MSLPHLFKSKSNFFLHVSFFYRLIGVWPNSYVYSKAIAENLLLTKGKDLPVGLFRPTIGKLNIKRFNFNRDQFLFPPKKNTKNTFNYMDIYLLLL